MPVSQFFRLAGRLFGLSLAMFFVIGGYSTQAHAVLFGGGGSSRLDCLLILDTPINDPVANPKRIRCTDGDAACDADATVNGVCVFPTAACANSTFNAAECDITGLESALIEHSEDNGDSKFDPELQALQSRIDNTLDLPTAISDDCTGFTNITVRVRGPLPGKTCRRGKKKMKIRSESTIMGGGKRFKDNDTLKMVCDPSPDLCIATNLFSGTFDRIQKQVLNTSCSLGGCHDSEGLAGGLLLEEGTAHGALVDVDPVNFTASSAGYKRVMSGDPANSFLLRKINGDLLGGMGARMPLGSKKVARSLRDLIELWIAGGAPETGWVPGTDD
jgi:hypothetical protein